MPLRRRSSRASLNLARGLHQDDEDFRRSRDTLSGNQTRRTSECLRPWTSMQGAEALHLPRHFSNDSTLLSNLIHRVSDATTEVLVQSVDAISSSSTLSMPLSVGAPRPSGGGQNTSNECSRPVVGVEVFRMTATCQPSYLHPPRTGEEGQQFTTSVSEGGDLKHLRQICKETEVVLAVGSSPQHCESFDTDDGPTAADPLSVSVREEGLEVPVRSWTPIAALKKAITVALQLDVEAADNLEVPREVCDLEVSVCEEHDFFLPMTGLTPLSWSPPPVLTNSDALLPNLTPRQDENHLPEANVTHRKTRSMGPDARQRGRTAERPEDNSKRGGLWVHSKSRTRKPDKEGDAKDARGGKSQKPKKSNNFVALLSRFFLGSDLCVSKPRRANMPGEESLATDSLCSMADSSETLPDACQSGQSPPIPASQQNSASRQHSSLSRDDGEQKGMKQESELDQNVPTSESDQNSPTSESPTDETSRKERSRNDAVLRETSGSSQQQEEAHEFSSETSESSDTGTVAEEGTYVESQSDAPKKRPPLPKVEPATNESQKSEVAARAYTRSVRKATLKRIERELEVSSSSSSEDNSTQFASRRQQQQQQPRLPRKRSKGRHSNQRRKLETSSESSTSKSDDSLIGDANFMSREIYKLKSAREIINALEEELAHAYTPKPGSKASRRERASTSRSHGGHTKEANREVSKQTSSVGSYTPIPMLHAPAVASEADLIRSGCPACRRTPQSALSTRNCQTNGSAFVAGMSPGPRLLSPTISRGGLGGFRPLQHPGCRPPVGYFQPMSNGQSAAYITPEQTWSCWGCWNIPEAHNN